jgi:hypothetical protein
MTIRYFLKYGEGRWEEKSRLEWIRAERAAGFRPKLPWGQIDTLTVCATSGFHRHSSSDASSVSGVIVDMTIYNCKQFLHDPTFPILTPDLTIIDESHRIR